MPPGTQESSPGTGTGTRTGTGSNTRRGRDILTQSILDKLRTIALEFEISEDELVDGASELETIETVADIILNATHKAYIQPNRF